MVVQHNLKAMNSNRMLGVTQKTVAGSTEKLSSGYKINRAADNAAGLSISEKMRKQIRGLTQASANAEDGISSVQTAEGALQEVTDMLQRMNELAVQAANGTNSITDRQYIQDEVDQLVTEIDRVAETTKFNETYLLKGDNTKASTKVFTTNYAVTYTVNQGTNKADVKYNVDYIGEANLYFVNSTSVSRGNPSTPITADIIKKGDDVTKYLQHAEKEKNGKITAASFNSDSYAVFKNADVQKLVVETTAGAPQQQTLKYIDGQLTAGNAAYILDTETNAIIKVGAGESLTTYMDVSDDKQRVTVKEQYRLLDEISLNKTDIPTAGGTITIGTTLGSFVPAVDAHMATEFRLAESAKKLYDADGKEVSGVALNQYFDENGQYTGGLYADTQATKAVLSDVLGADEETKIGTYITKNYAQVTADLSFSLHVGADSARTNKIQTNLQSMSSAALGVNKLSSKLIGIVDDSGDNATDAIDAIANALQKVSTQRSALGAIQNRLEHTIKNLDNVVENTTSAESSIRDTDMATEMVKYSNANILSQAGQSMLSQANQSNQGVLSILG